MDRIFFSPSTMGFYPSTAFSEAEMPVDCVEVSEDEYINALAGPIAVSEDGRPIREEWRDSPEQIQAAKVATVQSYMDAAAQKLRYDNITTAITYADEPAVPKFQSEGQAFRAWRSLVWDKCYEILGEVNDGKRPIPTDEELIGELPELVI